MSPELYQSTFGLWQVTYRLHLGMYIKYSQLSRLSCLFELCQTSPAADF